MAQSKNIFFFWPKRQWDVFYQVSFGQSGAPQQLIQEYKANGFRIMKVVFDWKKKLVFFV